MQRTIRLELHPTKEQADVLFQTLEQHTACFNAVAAHGWQEGIKNGVQLHKDTYSQLRERFPRLPSQLVCAARVKATEAVASALALTKGKKVSGPKSKNCPIRYDARSYRVLREEQLVSLATLAGRQKVAFGLYDHARKAMESALSFHSADVICRDGRWFLHLVVTLPEPVFESSGEVVGCDFGITRPAVASNNRFYGEKRWKNIERRYFKHKRALQSKGTKSARRHLKRLRRKVKRFRIDCDHVVSKRLVQNTSSGSVIVVENLTEIRQRMKARKGSALKRQMHQWSFARLRALMEYKAQAKGIVVVGVDPRHTSQACCHCGFKHRFNRKSQSLFHCRECGFELNADLNASRNIAQKYLAALGKSEGSGVASITLLSGSY
ncbi:transposase [bacterium]|nr:MAG: transposase [bacterium]